MVQIAPSLLSCDFSCLEHEIRTVEVAGADLLHLDVMDGHFVPNLTFGPVVIKGIRKLTSLPLDAHLMVETPERWVEKFISAGVDWISFHIEVAKNPKQVINLVKSSRLKVGLAINPPTPLESIINWVNDVDFILVMTVNPGFGGQEFISEPLEKVKALSKMGVMVEVDGGVNLSNVSKVADAGASTIVSGAGVFNTKDPGTTLKKLKSIANGTQM
ncbi:MAG: ribulose-phosphate 3-epimerase [bacterium]|nr:ribulose-phosphate 3-epimerase [bacterium]